MQRSMIKIIFTLFAVMFSGAKAENDTCDRVLDTMIDSCKAIRNTLISLDSLDTKVACCKNARYDLCVKGVKGYVTVAKTTRVCQEAGYEEKVQALESNVAMQAVQKLCETFDTKSCITDSLQSTWTSISETLNPTNLSETISRQFNDAMNTMREFVKKIGGDANASGQQGLNHYSVVPDQSASSSENSFSFSKLFNSITSGENVEVVAKNGENKPQDGGNTFGGEANKMLDSVLGMFRRN